jgi:hypothetical protein
MQLRTIKQFLNLKIIVGSFLPEAQKRVLLGAHWDSRPMADYDPNPANRTNRLTELMTEQVVSVFCSKSQGNST